MASKTSTASLVADPLQPIDGLQNLYVVPEENNTVWVSTRFPLRDQFCKLTVTIENSKLKNAQATLFTEGKNENGKLVLHKQDYSAVMFADRQLHCPLFPP